MPKGEIGRAPDAPLRTRRAIDQMVDIFNDLIREGVLVQGPGGDWTVRPDPTQLPAVSFPRPREGERGKRGVRGPQGATGATGATGASGTSGGAGSRGQRGRRGEDARNRTPGGLSPLQPPGTSTQFLAGNGQWLIPGGTSGGGGATAGFDLVVSTSGDETVTNSATYVDHTELQHSVTAGSCWHYTFIFFYSGNDATKDIKINWNVTAGTFTEWHNFWTNYTTTDGFQAGQVRTNAGTDWSAAFQMGVDGASGLRTGWLSMLALYTNDATAKLQFAETATGVGTSVTIENGTKLYGIRYR